MAKTITIQSEYGSPSITVWVNGVKCTFDTGKEVEVDDASYEVLQNMINAMPKEVAPADTETKTVRVKVVDQEKEGIFMYSNKSTLNTEELIALHKAGNMLVAEYHLTSSGRVFVFSDYTIADNTVKFHAIVNNGGLACATLTFGSDNTVSPLVFKDM